MPGVYGRRRREQTPLLQDQVFSLDEEEISRRKAAAAGGTSINNHKSCSTSLRGLFSSAKSLSPLRSSTSWTKQNTSNSARTLRQPRLDTRRLRVPRDTTIGHSSSSGSTSNSSNNYLNGNKGSAPAKQRGRAPKRQQNPNQSHHQNNPTSLTPPPRGGQRGAVVLPENQRDSSKKERPFPVPIRRIQQHFSAKDPPEGREERDQIAFMLRLASATEEEDEQTEIECTEVDLDADNKSVAVSADTGVVEHISPVSSTRMSQQQQDYNFITTKDSNGMLEEAFSNDFFSPRSHESESTTFRSLPPTPSTSAMATLQHSQQQDARTRAPSTPQHYYRTIQQILSRPFSRSALPNYVARRIVAEVADPEWDARLGKHRYRILVQQRQVAGGGAEQQDKLRTIHTGVSASATSAFSNNNPTPSLNATSFTTAYTWRTLSDFEWLAKSLNKEFHGALLIPTTLDSIVAKYKTSTNNNNFSSNDTVVARGSGAKRPVPASELRDWLNDILNGVRGNGELILETPKMLASILQSESMETFLYKIDLPAGSVVGESDDDITEEEAKKESRTNASSASASFLLALWSKPLEFCVGTQPDMGLGTTSGKSSPHRTKQQLNNFCSPAAGGGGTSLPMELLTSCAKSRAQLYSDCNTVVDDSTVGELELDESDNNNNNPTQQPPKLSLYAQNASQLVQAEAELALNYHKTAVVVLNKLKIVQQEEEIIAQYWKRFSTSLLNLFAHEKEAENKKLLGGTVKRENMPYRKVSQNGVDESLHLMAKTKNERALPALAILHDMLSAYAADLHSVGPAVEAYKEAASAAYADDGVDDHSDEDEDYHSWEDHIKTLASTVDDVVKHNGKRSGSKKHPAGKQLGYSERRSILQERLQTNEQLLRHSLTSLCRATPIRVARMAWRHWSTEASQCAALHAAAISFKANIDVVSKDSISKMTKRHLQEEREDDLSELDVITRIVSIQKSKSHNADGTTIGNEQQVEVDSDSNNEERSNAVRRGRALDIARDRVGRWDSKLSLAIMEAVQVDDPSVRVEETTRELRLVRKYAIGLRDHVNRCIEAIQFLRTIFSETGRPDQRGRATKGIFEKRRELLKEIAKLFSGKLVVEGNVPKSSSPSMAVLARAGVDTTDPFGWGVAVKEIHKEPTTPESARSSRDGRVGELAVAYFHARDAQAESLLKSIFDLLTDYFDRIEEIEGFVYMECVGIQLERHFSQRRAKALSDFEKKTDITSAINVATRKRLPKLVKELQSKLEQLGPEVSHTLVKETKEMHLESKSLKAELHEIAIRRLTRARETSTERVVELMSLWAKEEENAATSELKSLGEAMSALERAVGNVSIDSLVYRVSQEAKSSPVAGRADA